jgi:putative ABC transport system permease protein
VNAITLPRLQFLPERLFGNYRQGILMLQLAVGILLLMVCINIAGMMLARSESRYQEMGIRIALGASRNGIIRQLLTESLSLAIPGLLLGVLLSQALLQLITSNVDVPSWVKLTPDIRFLAFCGLLMGGTTVIFGLAPALQAAGIDVQRTLHEASSRSSSNRATRHGLRVLVAGEVALAFVLLVSAGLMLRSWQKVLTVDRGFQVDNVLTFQINLSTVIYTRPEDWARFYEQLMDRCRKLPGVLAVTGTMPLPLGGYSYSFMEIEGAPPRASNEPEPWILTRNVFPNYFKTMGIPLQSGRAFTEEDGRTKGSQVAIVNQSFARRFWPDANPIGKRVRYRDEAGAGDWRTVVGLIRDNKDYGLDQEIPPEAYYPYNQIPNNAMYILIRSSVNPNGLLGPIRSQLREMDPDIEILNPMTMTERVLIYTATRIIRSILMTLFAVAALLIAAAGIYGVVSYTVNRRTHEIGIRIALGATRRQVLSMVVGGGMRLVVAGLVFGVAGAYVASRFLRNMLFGITSFDALTYLVVTVLLIGVVAGASLLPARWAATIDPIRALRSE